MIGIGALIHAAMMPIANTMFLTIIQTKVPAETQGRVFSITVSLAFSIMPLGMITFGPLSDIFGIYIIFISSLVLQTIIFLFSWLFSDIRNIKNSETKSDYIENNEQVEN